MHLSTVKKPFVLGVDWPWSSMSNLTCKSKFIPFWACPYNNLSPVQATITKFGPEIHLNTVKIPVDFGRDKPSASISFFTVKAIFLTYYTCNEVVGGVYWFHSVRPSLRPSVRPSVPHAVSALYHLQLWMDSFHIRHKWSLPWEGVSRTMTLGEVKGQGHRGQHPT